MFCLKKMKKKWKNENNWNEKDVLNRIKMNKCMKLAFSQI